MIYLTLVCSLLLSTSTLSLDIVHLRDASTITCSVVSWSKDGLRITQGTDQDQIVLPWHTVRRIESEEVSASFDAHLSRGELLWRAKSRLLRGDVALALPLFEEACIQLINTDGADAFLAVEGLLRCQVAFGNVDKSLIPWLQTIQHYELNEPPPFPALSPIIDQETYLCPYLPPVWSSAFIKDSISNFNSTQSKLNEITTVLLNGANAKDIKYQGAHFLHDIYVLMDPEHSQYSESLKATSERKELAPWKVAWTTYATALGLLKQENKQDAAMLKLAKVASTYGKQNPWIAGSAMTILADQLSKQGLTKASANVRAEMERVFPNHPIFRKTLRQTY